MEQQASGSPVDVTRARRPDDGERPRAYGPGDGLRWLGLARPLPLEASWAKEAPRGARARLPYVPTLQVADHDTAKMLGPTDKGPT